MHIPIPIDWALLLLLLPMQSDLYTFIKLNDPCKAISIETNVVAQENRNNFFLIIPFD